MLRTVTLFWTEGYRREKREREAAEANLKIAEQRSERLEKDKNDLEKWVKEWNMELDRRWSTVPLGNSTHAT